MKESNEVLLDTLPECEHGVALLRQMEADANLMRMSKPKEIAHASEVEFLLAPRFGLQQEKPDGSCKIRPVDNFSWSRSGGRCKKRRKLDSVNGEFHNERTIRHDNIHALGTCMRAFWTIVSVVPSLFKIDVDSAYRRIPVRPADWWATGIACKVDSSIFVAQHFTAPFGAASSNIGWEQVGDLIAKIVRVILRIGILRYVDDYFAPERAETMQHAAECVTRLVRALMGSSAIAQRKVEWGLRLIVLGIHAIPSERGFTFRPSADKVEK